MEMLISGISLTKIVVNRVISLLSIPRGLKVRSIAVERWTFNFKSLAGAAFIVVTAFGESTDLE
jgi:hypothetical protein